VTSRHSTSGRSGRQRLLALVGIVAIVGVAVAVLFVAGVLGNQGDAEAVELLDTPQPDGQSLDVGPERGKLAPDFEISDYDGARHRLSDFRGKVVYVNFWATWCVPCQVELPEIDVLEREYADDLVVITVNRREPQGDAEAFFRNVPNLQGENGVDFAVNGLDPDDTLYDAYRGLGMPTSIFIDVNGVVTARADGLIRLDDMREAVEQAKPST
jgi:thiol-disulfide isomerase/thioredoxin